MAQARVTKPGSKAAEKLAAEKRLEVKRMREVLKILEREYPEAECSLHFETPFQLLVATILSAQCTDERVNKTTPALFARFPDARAMAKANIKELEKLVQPTGFYRNKARSILESSQALVERHGGEVPQDLEALTQLRGVGRKTANVVLGVAFGTPGLVVDTHVGRVSRRLGFTKSMNPVKVESELMELVPRDQWTQYAHLLISHGREICTARRAYCEDCPLSRYCPKIGVN